MKVLYKNHTLYKIRHGFFEDYETFVMLEEATKEATDSIPVISAEYGILSLRVATLQNDSC